MDFYILKKNNKLTAIPAEETKCKEYLDSGYSYVNKVAACNESAAVKKQLNESSKVNHYLAISVGMLLVLGLFWYFK